MHGLSWEPLREPVFCMFLYWGWHLDPGWGWLAVRVLWPPVVCSAGRSGAVVPVLVLLFGALWFILRGDLLNVLPCASLLLCFSVLLALRLTRLGERECFSYVWSICACLDLSVSSSSWCLGRAAVCDCGTPWTFLLPFSNLTGPTRAK